MKTIYRYSLTLSEDQIIQLPDKSIPLFAGIQKEVLSVWVEVLTTLPMSSLNFHVYGTLHKLAENVIYLNSVLSDTAVWHVYWSE